MGYSTYLRFDAERGNDVRNGKNSLRLPLNRMIDAFNDW